LVVKLLAVALFLGLALVAGGLVYQSREDEGGSDYSGYENVLRALGDSSTVQDVEQVKGPFYRIRIGTKCYLVDVSTQYKGDDTVWVTTSHC
jgi:hypothetical protein